MRHTVQRLTDTFHVALYGCGGTGSQVLTGLARIHHAITQLGHPGFFVHVHDPDKVSETNVGRQLFSPSDVGHYKADVLVNRLNLFYGINWGSEHADGGSYDEIEMRILCVDSRKARERIYRDRRFYEDSYWMDCGNSDTSGQVILGGHGLVHPYAMFPELIDTEIPEDNAPSCSMAEALESQDLFINQAVATHALHLIWTLLRQGGLDNQGYFINLAGSVRPIPCKTTTEK